VHELVSVEDYREVARRRLPRAVFRYIEGGAESDSTVRSNPAAFEAVTFRPKGRINPARVETGTSLLGNNTSMPVLLAPCGGAHIVNSQVLRTIGSSSVRH